MVFLIFTRNGQSTNITSLAEAEESNQLEHWKPDPDASITMEGDIEARKLALGMNYEYLESTLGIISSVHICASPERAALESSIHIAEQLGNRTLNLIGGLRYNLNNYQVNERIRFTQGIVMMNGINANTSTLGDGSFFNTNDDNTPPMQQLYTCLINNFQDDDDDENGNENDVFLIITNSTIINLLLKDIVVNDNINYAMMNTGATCIEINNNNDMILHYVNRIDHVLLTLDARL